MDLPEINTPHSVQINSDTDQPQTIHFPPQYFGVDPTELDADLCRFGKVMLYYADIQTRLEAEVARKKARLKELDGELDLSIRATGTVSGDRLTEGKIGAMVATHPSRKKLVAELVECERNLNMMTWAMKVLQGKKDILIALTYREKEQIKSDRF